MKTCVIEDAGNLDKDTPIYKYLSIESFLHLLKYKTLMFSKLSCWPDAFEGARFEFFKQINKEDELAGKTKDNFFGCSWTLQTEDSCFYSDSSEHRKAEEELRRHGSASMWEVYCSNGGARIKTTIRKVEKLFETKVKDYDGYKGKVCYEPSYYWDKTMKSHGLVSKLFIKRISFRHESEYRFILITEGGNKKNRIFIDVDQLYDFVDELLISPAVESRIWVSRMIYHYAVDTFVSPKLSGANRKNGKQLCKISNLYGNITEEI